MPDELDARLVVLPAEHLFGVSTSCRLRPVGRHEKLLRRILEGRSDANFEFQDLRSLLLHLGFDERTKGSLHIFRRADVEERINLQREGG